MIEFLVFSIREGIHMMWYNYNQVVTMQAPDKLLNRSD